MTSNPTLLLKPLPKVGTQAVGSAEIGIKKDEVRDDNNKEEELQAESQDSKLDQPAKAPTGSHTDPPPDSQADLQTDSQAAHTDSQADSHTDSLTDPHLESQAESSEKVKPRIANQSESTPDPEATEPTLHTNGHLDPNSPRPLNSQDYHRFLDDSSELSELDDSEAETDRLDLDDDVENGDSELLRGSIKRELEEKSSPQPSSPSSSRKRSASTDSASNKKRKIDGKEGSDENESVEVEAEISRIEDLESTESKPLAEDEQVEPTLSEPESNHEISQDNEKHLELEPSEKEEDNEGGSSTHITPLTRAQKAKNITNGGTVDSENQLESENDKAQDPAVVEQEELEHQKQRNDAILILTEIEVEFAKLRDRLHEDKMARYVAEIQMCAEGTHPELASVYQQIERLRDDKRRLAEKRRDYQRACIDRQTTACRYQLHQQYLKDQADIRNKLLLKTTEEWYRVNRERRVMDALVPEFGYRVSSNVNTRIAQRMSVDYEINILSGLTKYIGFPAAPEMQPADEEEVLDDLRGLGIIR